MIYKKEVWSQNYVIKAVFHSAINKIYIICGHKIPGFAKEGLFSSGFCEMRLFPSSNQVYGFRIIIHPWIFTVPTYHRVGLSILILGLCRTAHGFYVDNLCAVLHLTTKSQVDGCQNIDAFARFFQIS